MDEKQPVDLLLFKEKAKEHKRGMKRFLSKLESLPTGKVNVVTVELEKKVWEEVDCLSCANCCKTMTPTFTDRDMKRISRHLGESVEDFKKKWLRKERKADGDWINRKEPCQFLNLTDNKCSIYEVRPADCAGFPHLGKNMKGYAHVHKQNLEYCPATYRMVELMVANSNRFFPVAVNRSISK
ncbi:MAG: YkgJ family cysteine cluster protein [Chitinophagaceae bacterium]